MRGNSQARFLGGLGLATAPGYPTERKNYNFMRLFKMNDEIFKKLCTIYTKYTSNKSPSEESQICMLWDINYPPDVLEITEQHQEIEESFNLDIDEDSAVEMFDMNLREASEFLKKLIDSNV